MEEPLIEQTVRLARVEEKIDALHSKVDLVVAGHQDQEGRIRSLEHHRSWLWGAWVAVITFFKFKTP